LHLLLHIWLSIVTVASAAETLTFGTGEVDPSVLRVGDQAEVSYRNDDPRSRSRFEEFVGMVVEVTPEFFVVEDDTDEAVITYDTVIRLDVTRTDVWTLDSLDIAMPQGALIEKYLEGRELTGLEGTWVWDDASFEIALIHTGAQRIPRYDYVGIILAAHSDAWRTGEIKLLLKETATEDTYSAVFILGDKTRYGVTVQIPEGRAIEASLPRPNSRWPSKRQINKTYPIPDEADADADSVDTAPEPEWRWTIGSGFFVTDDIVVTANHLVEGSDSIRVIFGGKTTQGTIRSRDKRNDIALVSVNPVKTVIPLIIGASDKTMEGDRIIASGYSPETAVRPSVNEGIISSVFGPNDDLTRYAISTQVSEAAVGGPLLNAANHIVGILLPTDSTSTGQVNIAAKSALLTSLLKLSSISVPTPSDVAFDPLETSLIAQMSRSCVAKIQARHPTNP